MPVTVMVNVSVTVLEDQNVKNVVEEVKEGSILLGEEKSWSETRLTQPF